MNILYLTNHLNVGGITSYVLSLASGMLGRGHRVYIASSAGKLLVKFRQIGAEFVPIPIRTKQEISPAVLLSFLKLSGFTRRHKIDIAHSNSRTTQVVAQLLRRRAGPAHIWTCHGFFKPRLFRKMLPCRGEKVIAISKEVEAHLVNDFKIESRDIRLVHNGIDVEKFMVEGPAKKMQVREQFGLEGSPVIGIIARLSSVKGHTYLVSAMREVVARFPRARLLIAGEGQTKDALVSQARSLGIENNVTIIDELEDTRDALSAMDIFVLPSLEEGLGLALMEAMAAGIPVIGSDIGGIRTLICDRHSGLLTRPKDPQSIAQAIIYLLENPWEAAGFAACARTFIKDNFSLDKMVTETERVYYEALA